MRAAEDKEKSRYAGRWGRMKYIFRRTRSVIRRKKTLTVSHLSEQKRRLWWLRIRLPHRGGQKRSILPWILDTGAQEWKRCIDWLIGRVIVVVDRGSGGKLATTMKRLKRWELPQRESNTNYGKKLTPLPFDPRKLYCTPVMFARFVCAFLSFVHASFLQNPKPEKPVKLSWNAPRIPEYIYILWFQDTFQ